MSKVLVLDAGHGLNTSGKQTMNGSKGVIKEWTMNSNVCNKIQAILKDYDVTIHRTDDTTGKTDISLSERVKRCNNYNPHLFVSIHHNAGGGVGTEVYWHTKGTAEDKKVASILAPKLASKCGMRNRGVKQASFAVLGCKPTAILVEGGFMDTVADYEIITSDKGQQAYAEAVAESIIEYLGLKKVVATTTQTPQWKKNDKGWWYEYADGSYPTSKWLKIDNEWYYFGADGYAYCDKWVQTDGVWYWLNGDCKMVKNCVLLINGKYYAFDKDGKMKTEVEVSNKGDLIL